MAEREDFEAPGAPPRGEHRHGLAGQPTLRGMPRCPRDAQWRGELGQEKADQGLERPASHRGQLFSSSAQALRDIVTSPSGCVWTRHCPGIIRGLTRCAPESARGVHRRITKLAPRSRSVLNASLPEKAF